MVDINIWRTHVVFEAMCVKCGRRWIDVCPEGTLLKDIECPDCGAGFVIKTGQDMRAYDE